MSRSTAPFIIVKYSGLKKPWDVLSVNRIQESTYEIGSEITVKLPNSSAPKGFKIYKAIVKSATEIGNFYLNSILIVV